MSEVKRCLICSKILDSPRAKYCKKCRNNIAGRRYSKVIHIRVTEEQSEFWKQFTQEQKNELTELFRKQLEALITVKEILKNS